MTTKTKKMFDVHATITIPVSVKVEADNVAEAIDKGLADTTKWIDELHLKNENPSIHAHDVQLCAVFDDEEDEQVY